MPDYKGKPCRGLCESLLNECEHPEYFVKTAEEYGAEPVERKGSIDLDGRMANWSYWGLQLPKDRQKEVMDLYGAGLVVTLMDFPCFIGCPIFDEEKE